MTCVIFVTEQEWSNVRSINEQEEANSRINQIEAGHQRQQL